MINRSTIYKNIIGIASEYETRKYSKWLKEASSHRKYADKIKKHYESDDTFTPLTQPELSKKFNLLLENVKEINSHKDKKIVANRTLRLSTISIAAAIIAVSFVIYFQHPQKISTIANVSTEKEIKTPTLVLGNGENIALDGNEGQINNHLIEKIENKKISYLPKNKQGVKVDKLIYNTILIPSCHTYTVLLEDSTEVFLNANSQLCYPVNFTGDTREVFLKGEAYFKVSKDKKPFIVSTSELSVKVYGTEFNINTDNMNRFETVLVSGSIGLTINNSESQEIKMVPNQRFVLNPLNKESHLDVVNPENYIAWKDGLFQYDDEKLCVVLNRIAKWYGIEFDYSNIESMNTPISIKLTTATKLDNILSAIENVSNTIIIKKSINNYVIEKK